MLLSPKGVVATFVADGPIAVLKVGGYLLMGNPWVLSETDHSVADTGNQVFLLVESWYGRK